MTTGVTRNGHTSTAPPVESVLQPLTGPHNVSQESGGTWERGSLGRFGEEAGVPQMKAGLSPETAPRVHSWPRAGAEDQAVVGP